MSRCEVRLLGEFQLTVDGVVVRFPTRKSESLFAYLVLNAGKPIPRSRLAGSLWPDVDEHRARRNLSTTLWRVKATALLAPGIEITNPSDSLVSRVNDADVDVARFQELIRLADVSNGSERIRALQRAEAMYHGDLLEGYEEEWCEADRVHLRTSYLRVLKSLLEVHRSSGEYRQAIECARKVIEREPLDEDAHRELILLYYLTGDRAAATGRYGVLKKLLEDELGVQPSPATTELWEYIRSQIVLPAGHSISSVAGRDFRLDEFAQIPIVGREKERLIVLQMLEQAARGNGGAVVISGEPGIGKTRLSKSVADEARLRGFEVLHGQCPDLQDPPPYQVFVQALWPKISALESRVEEEPSLIFSVLRALSPHSPLQDDAGFVRRAPIRDSAIVIEAFLNILTDTVAGRPMLLVLEDLHRADKASLALLATLLVRVSTLRVLVLCTVRTHEEGAGAVQSILLSNGAECIQLPGLSEGESRRLVHAALGSRNVGESLVRYVWERTWGTPLFVFEFLKLLEAEGMMRKDAIGHWSLNQHALAARPTKVPSRVHEVIRRRVEMLESRTKGILFVAAVLGSDVEFDHLRQMARGSEDEFIESTERLLEVKLLFETSAGFRFPHDSVRSVALSMLSKPRLRTLHLRAARLLERAAPGRTEDLAWHFHEAGDLERVLAYAEASGDKARLVYANSNAASWYGRALETLSRLGTLDALKQRRQISLLLKRQEVLDLAGNRQRQLSDIETILGIAESIGDQALIAQAFLLRANVLTRMNSHQEALNAAGRAARLFRIIADISGEAKAHEAMGNVYMNLRRQDGALATFRAALRLFGRVRDHEGGARALTALGAVHMLDGNSLAAMRHFDKAECVLRESGDRRALAVTLVLKGILYRSLGRTSTSETLLLAGIDLLKRVGDRVGQARGLSQLAYTHITMGRLREALHESRRALRIAQYAMDIRGKIMFLNNAAYSVFRCLGDFRRAERFVSEALRLVAEHGHMENAAIYNQTMSATFLDSGDLNRALIWAKQSEAAYRAWKRPHRYLGTEIQFQLGAILVELGEYSSALYHLKKAILRWQLCREALWLPHAISMMALAHLGQGRSDAALQCARMAGRLLRRIDGTEQIQKIYWNQFRVFKSTGEKASARRALRRAYWAVIEQASTLKGRMRRRFLTEVRTNREILEEVARTQRSPYYHNVESIIAEPPHVEVGSSPGNGMNQGQAGVALGRTNGRQDIERRRRVLLGLLRGMRITQRDLAQRLGVSIRTIRNDMTVLRREGLLAERIPR